MFLYLFEWHTNGFSTCFASKFIMYSVHLNDLLIWNFATYLEFEIIINLFPLYKKKQSCEFLFDRLKSQSVL